MLTHHNIPSLPEHIKIGEIIRTVPVVRSQQRQISMRMVSEWVKVQQLPPEARNMQGELIEKMYCPIHRQLLVNQCLNEECGQYICGRIECYDRHFHGLKLNIQKVNLIEVAKSLQKSQKLEEVYHQVCCLGIKLQEQLGKLSTRNHDIFKAYRDLCQASNYLSMKQNAPLTQSDIQRLTNIVALYSKMHDSIAKQEGILHSTHISNSLIDQIHISQYLKTHFNQFFRDVYFERVEMTIDEIVNRELLMSRREQPFEGLVIMYFTDGNQIVGEFIGNSCVETASLFLPSFSFMVDPQGNMQKGQFCLRYQLVMPDGSQVANQVIARLQIQVGDSMWNSSTTIFRVNRIETLLCLI